MMVHARVRVQVRVIRHIWRTCFFRYTLKAGFKGHDEPGHFLFTRVKELGLRLELGVRLELGLGVRVRVTR